jgi:hypothetical protein
MANTLVQSDSDYSLMETTFPARTTIDRKFTVAAPKIHSKNTNTDLVEPLRRLSDLVDGFVCLSHASQSPIGKSENPNKWNFSEYVNAILSIVGAHGGARFERPPNDSPICHRKSSHQTMPDGPCAMCIGVRSSLLTKNYCSEAGTW